MPSSGFFLPQARPIVDTWVVHNDGVSIAAVWPVVVNSILRELLLPWLRAVRCVPHGRNLWVFSGSVRFMIG